jgi:hypothetical protein
VIELPSLAKKGFFAMKGPMPVYLDSRRGYHRFHLRDKAILKHQSKLLGTYTIDVSRQGIGFLSPYQLWPKERVQLLLTSGREYDLQVTRCRRRGKNLFECGGRFVISSKLQERTNEVKS